LKLLLLKREKSELKCSQMLSVILISIPLMVMIQKETFPASQGMRLALK
jgi:hypothetical protein